MKKLFIFVLVISFVVLLPVTSFATEFTVSEGEQENSYDYNTYMPDEIKELLNQNGVSDIESVGLSEILLLAFDGVRDVGKGYVTNIICVIYLSVLLVVIKKIINNSSALSIIEFLFVVIICAVLSELFLDIYTKCSEFLAELSDFLTLALPSFISVLLVGGAVNFSSAMSGSFTVIIYLLENTVTYLGCGIIAITFALIILEKISANVSEIRIVATLKKHSIGVIVFITSLFLTVLSAQSVISARADGIAMKSVKFAASSFVPIIGGAVGESLKTVISGVEYLKTTLGTGILFSLLLIVLPQIFGLFIIKILTALSELFTSFLGASSINGVLNNFCDVIDIALSVIISVTLLSIIPIFAFIIISF